MSPFLVGWGGAGGSVGAKLCRASWVFTPVFFRVPGRSANPAYFLGLPGCAFAASPVACRLSKMGTVEFSLIIDVWLQKSFYLPLNLQLQVKSLIMMNYASGIDQTRFKTLKTRSKINMFW